MKQVTFLLKKNGTRKIRVSHSGDAEDKIILGSAAMSLGEKLPTFEKIGMPSSSESGTPSKMWTVFP